jgi:3-deoxy-D-manno-octulosonic-acid transferase
MTFFYNIGIRIYYFLILVASLFNRKAKLWIAGRSNTFKYLKKHFPAREDVAWFHVSSLGEFEQGRPVIEAFKKQYPNTKILLTFFSPSGYEIRKNYSDADFICYIPIDTKKNAKQFIQLIKPEYVFFVKYDYWYHHIKQAKNSGAKLFLVSGIFRQKQVFFKPYGTWYRNILRRFDYLFLQNQESEALLHSINIENISVAGDTRFDRVTAIAKNSKNIPIAKKFSAGSKTIVAGSTWPADEELLVKYIETSGNKAKLILAPHEIHSSHIESIEKLINVPYTLYSKADHADLEETQILIIDNIGMLSSIYKYGQIAYIGGGFGNGIHNTLEAAVYDIPVIFGPNYQRFQEAVELIKAEGAITISEYHELEHVLNNFLSNNIQLTDAGNAAGNYVHKNTGATRTIMRHLESI